VDDLKGVMVLRGVPWTHAAIVRLVRDADEDGDGKLSFREVSGACRATDKHALLVGLVRATAHW